MLTENRKNRIQDVVGKRQSGITIVLEDIHDPHNAEAIMRSCDAFGVQRVCVVFEQEKYYNPKRIGKATSSSANKWLDFSIYRSSTECINSLKHDGYRLIVTALNEQSTSIHSSQLLHDKIAILVGNEHRGLSKEMVTRADEAVTIPMLGMVESLNVSVATAIVLYEITRQRIQSGKTYSLNEKEKDELVDIFSNR